MTQLLQTPEGAPSGVPEQKGGEHQDTGGGSQPGPRAARSPPTDVRQTIAHQVGNLSTHFFTVFSSTLAALGSLLIITFVAIYVALDPRTYRRGILHLVPHGGRAKAIEVMDATGVTLRRWLVAQLIGMVVIGALTTVALLLLDVRAAVALGIIAGFLEFVPVLRPDPLRGAGDRHGLPRRAREGAVGGAGVPRHPADRGERDDAAPDEGGDGPAAGAHDLGRR